MWTGKTRGTLAKRMVALRRALLFGWIAIALAACGTQAVTPAVLPTAEPSPTPKPTFTALPTALPTATLAPTATLVPTVTPLPPTPTVVPTPTQDLGVSPLTGLPVADPALIKRRILAVRIGNDPNIRPQEGLGLADLVYEEIMDGNTVTRFTALFLESEAERLRPVRSARLSGLYIIPQYDAAYVHSGASDGVRWRLSQATFVNLDEYFHPKPYRLLAGYDWRGRLYTSTELLRAYLREKGLERDEAIRGYTFDPKPPQGKSATAIQIPYPRSSVVDWTFDATKGLYLRQVQGEPHLEGLTQEQIAASNVIIFYAEHRKTDIVEDTLGATAIDIYMQGSGRVQVCRDGVVIEGRWSQPQPDKLIAYYDANGQVIPLRPGKTWIQLVPPDAGVEIK